MAKYPMQALGSNLAWNTSIGTKIGYFLMIGSLDWKILHGTCWEVTFYHISLFELNEMCDELLKLLERY
jgi:hypothetical protein